MKALLQRVSEASVEVEGKEVGRIGKGLLVLLGVVNGDTSEDVEYLGAKIPNLRIFGDGRGKMNLSVREVGGGILVVSQFTLAADCRKGNRPSFDNAGAPDLAEKFYLDLIGRLSSGGGPVEAGRFGAAMKVRLVNDGPVTILLDSRREKP
ncbi:MAG: D-aminoacyl-tRNA deacylase [Nitrospiraceae bacterium]|nr:D-aminoacyl-tRNA deacylase [Nitrospiraceae bacterium]